MLTMTMSNTHWHRHRPEQHTMQHRRKNACTRLAFRGLAPFFYLGQEKVVQPARFGLFAQFFQNWWLWALQTQQEVRACRHFVQQTPSASVRGYGYEVIRGNGTHYDTIYI